MKPPACFIGGALRFPDALSARPKADHAARAVLPLIEGIVCVALLAFLPPGLASAADKYSVEDLSRLSIDELSNIEITSVSKKAEPLSRAPAAVYVITSEDIRRSGAISLPEVLRLAPNLTVTRVNGLHYSISARGFNTFAAADKLLVLIDGRSIYTTLHGGVFWDQQQVMLADIERIEVISGPGGTLWGANAVNGVMNIITRSAKDTKGGMMTGSYGNVDKDINARYGAAVGEEGAVRVYGMGFDRGHSELRNGTKAGDDWSGKQGGFRSDWNGARDSITLQGDIFESAPAIDGEISGKNMLARWNRTFDGGSALQLQTYYDTVKILDSQGLDELTIYDILYAPEQ